MKKIKLLMGDVGKCVRVKWDDVVTVDSILVDLDSPSDPKPRGAVVFSFSQTALQTVDLDQIVGIGGYVTPKF